ncbi:serine hydrolase [Corallococcus sp. CA047B]|uniref:serine hydrolase domain-containing protein n=1 Tax=Corallococcus sp. CA047B TaxID=2316729 RepID=UPI001F32FD0D|nr:serine hydrolase domain-containing protein [Corallococcus sp. CA047B]
MLNIRALLLLALTLTACGEASSSPDDHPTPPDAGVLDAGTVDPFAKVDAMVAESVADAGVPGVTLAVYDAQDRRVFVKSYGDFAPDRRVAIASASKMASGLALFRLVDAGVLSLDSTTGEVLGWTGPQAGITLRHLLSFTSGLEPNHPCTVQMGGTLAQCVEAIAAGTPVAPPGTRFDYGSAHLHVAARMAEVRTGKPWQDIFDEQVKTPLGLTSAELAYYTFPRNTLGTSNPLIAGGLRSTMDEYAKLLGVVYHRGTVGGVPFASASLFDAQSREPYDVVIGSSPMVDGGLTYHYGLTAWLECDTPSTGCAVVSSPGAFGFTPWVDRDSGYYAILGMQLEATNEERVGAFSVGLEQRLRPEIRAAVAATP